MGKFSLKRGDGDDDSNRLALFGSRSKSKSPAPPADNPYAQASVPPDPYTRAKMSAGVGPAPGAGYGSGPGPQGPYGGASQPPPRQNPYGGNNAYGPPQPSQGGPPPQRGGYGAEKFGNQNGYGAERSGGNPYGGFNQPTGPARRGGYGGLGPTNDYDQGNDADRDQLFGGARERIENREHNQMGGPPGYQYNGGDTSGADRSYGAYGDRQLTAEEEEEEDIQATKQEIRFMKQQDVSSTRNALQMAAQAEESGRNTLARLGAQGERMHNTERNLDIGNNHINIAEDKSRELKKLNRSMFAVHVNNPFTAKDRQAQKDEKIMERHRLEREQRESTREATFKSTQRMNQNFKGIEDTYQPAPGRKKVNLAERSKYQFEADEEDDQMEDEIDRNLDDLAGAAGRLNMLAKATGQEIEEQNKLIARIGEKVRFINMSNGKCRANHYHRVTNSTTDFTGRLRSSGESIKHCACSYLIASWVAIVRVAAIRFGQ
jgi:protein transport protein SEC9